MTLTEEEARKKWCPMTHSKEYARSNLGQLCIASECMAWRWFDTVSDDGTACHWKPTPHAPRLPTDQPEQGKPLDQRRGRCGLAGNP